MFTKIDYKLSDLTPFILDAVSEGIIIFECVNDKFSITNTNRSLRKTMGLKNVVSGQFIEDIFDNDITKWLNHQLFKVSKFQEIIETDIALEICRENKQHLNIRFMPVIKDNYVQYIIGTIRTLNDDLKINASLKQKQEHYITALEYAPYGVCFVSDNGKPTMVNRALCQWLDMSVNSILGVHITNLFSEGDKLVFKQALERVINSSNSYRGIELQLKTSKGEAIWVAVSMSRVAETNNPYTIIQFVDITKQKEEENELMKLATQDHLTELSNRKIFDENLSMSLKQARRYGRNGAVIYIDLDDFKGINDNFGHKAGDAILQEVGKVLKEVFRETDTVSRIGGDEFAVIMNEVDADEANFKAKIVEQKIKDINITAHNKQVGVSASMGVQIFNSNNSLSEDDLVAAADKAMYQKKAESKLCKKTLDA